MRKCMLAAWGIYTLPCDDTFPTSYDLDVSAFTCELLPCRFWCILTYVLLHVSPWPTDHRFVDSQDWRPLHGRKRSIVAPDLSPQCRDTRTDGRSVCARRPLHPRPRRARPRTCGRVSCPPTSCLARSSGCRRSHRRKKSTAPTSLYDAPGFVSCSPPVTLRPSECHEQASGRPAVGFCRPPDAAKRGLIELVYLMNELSGQGPLFELWL